MRDGFFCGEPLLLFINVVGSGWFFGRISSNLNGTVLKRTDNPLINNFYPKVIFDFD